MRREGEVGGAVCRRRDWGGGGGGGGGVGEGSLGLGKRIRGAQQGEQQVLAKP